jgi:putative endonuclease
MFYIYLIEDTDGNLYTGYSADLKRRLAEHNQGQTQTTRGAKWKCIYYEACLNEKDARRREKYLKTTQGRRMLKLRLKEYMYQRRES